MPVVKWVKARSFDLNHIFVVKDVLGATLFNFYILPQSGSGV